VKIPRGVNIVDGKWALKTKYDEKGSETIKKARWVAKGYSQQAGCDYTETFAPVAMIGTLRTIVCIAAIEGWELDNMDVETAFLQSEVEEEIYVRQPIGFEEYGPDGEPLVCRLNKSLYGLRQAPRNWNKALSQYLVDDYGLKTSDADPCLYVGDVTKEGYIVVLVYVDDIIVAGSDRAEVDRFKAAISKRSRSRTSGC